MSRHIARKINFSDPEKAYLAGLLHDLGIIVNLWILPKEFGSAWELGKAEGIPLHEAEQKAMGLPTVRADVCWRNAGNLLPN